MGEKISKGKDDISITICLGDEEKEILKSFIHVLSLNANKKTLFQETIGGFPPVRQETSQQKNLSQGEENDMDLVDDEIPPIDLTSTIFNLGEDI